MQDQPNQTPDENVSDKNEINASPEAADTSKDLELDAESESALHVSDADVQAEIEELGETILAADAAVVSEDEWGDEPALEESTATDLDSTMKTESALDDDDSVMGAAHADVESLSESGSDAESEGSSVKNLNLKLEDLSNDQLDALMGSMEAILFMSDQPLSIAKLRSIIDSDISLPVYRQLMTRLRQDYALSHRGIDLVEVSMGFQMRTKPHMAPILRRLVKTVPLKLTSPMMEVLALVAYKQPVTKDEVDQVRGVDCSYLLRTLMDKKLLRISGRSELPGRPMLYSTTHEFLELFSLKDLTALPPIHEIEAMVAESEVGAENREEDALKEFGSLVDESLKTKLFTEGDLDQELEDIKAVIEGISTSTIFVDEQKARERLFAKLSALEAKGLTLDAEENEVPLDSVSREEILPTLLSKLHERLVAKYAAVEAAAAQEAVAASEDTQTEAVENDALNASDDNQTEPTLSLEASEVTEDMQVSVTESQEASEVTGVMQVSLSEVQAASESKLDVPLQYEPSAELVEQAHLAEQRRHAEQLTQTLQESSQQELQQQAEKLEAVAEDERPAADLDASQS